MLSQIRSTLKTALSVLREEYRRRPTQLYTLLIIAALALMAFGRHMESSLLLLAALTIMASYRMGIERRVKTATDAQVSELTRRMNRAESKLNYRPPFGETRARLEAQWRSDISEDIEPLRRDVALNSKEITITTAELSALLSEFKARPSLEAQVDSLASKVHDVDQQVLRSVEAHAELGDAHAELAQAHAELAQAHGELAQAHAESVKAHAGSTEWTQDLSDLSERVTALRIDLVAVEEYIRAARVADSAGQQLPRNSESLRVEPPTTSPSDSRHASLEL